jgi:hypothetical protein
MVLDDTLSPFMVGVMPVYQRSLGERVRANNFCFASLRFLVRESGTARLGKANDPDQNENPAFQCRAGMPG